MTVGKVGKNSFLHIEGIELNLATVCLCLFENIEEKINKSIVKIKCRPSDDAFERKIILKGQTLQSIEMVLLDILSKFAVMDQEIVLSTQENNITLVGVCVAPEYLNELCCKKDGKIIMKESENALALAYLQLHGYYVRGVMEENDKIIKIEFGEEN